MKDLHGKNAIITGASRGLGVHIARALAGRGVNVALAARSGDALEATRAVCERAGVRAISVACDVTSQLDRERLVAVAAQELGPLDILVNNAGIEVTAALEDFSLQQIEDVIRTNLNAPIALTQLVLPAMRARRSGVVVNIASMAGKAGVPYNSIYSATKHGLCGFTESMNMELDGSGVRMGVVCPGFVSEAGMWADHGGKAPLLLREVPPAKVASAVLKVVEGASEVLVNAGPVKPLLLLGVIAPALKTTVVKRMGLTRLMRDGAAELKAHAGVARDAARDREAAASRH
ncbi:MAG: SDR family oxidoreductase [Dehalococcoidia bacterium]|nr:SDR family oxidoreductase [Dehalococcoidia bacterium]